MTNQSSPPNVPKHTPTPWYQDGWVIRSKGGNAIAELSFPQCTWKEYGIDNANAAHIVHCVNNYEALKASLDELLRALKIHHNFCVKNEPGYSEHGEDAIAFRSCRIVIATAEKVAS